MIRTRMVVSDGRVFVLGPESDEAYERGGHSALMVLLEAKGIDLEKIKGRRLP